MKGQTGCGGCWLINRTSFPCIPKSPQGFVRHSATILLLWLLNYWFFPNPEWRGNISNFLYVLTNLVVVLVLWRAGRYSRLQDPVTGRGWTWLAIGQSMWLFGDLTYTGLVIWLRIEPFPSIADVFYLLYYPFYFFGAIQLAARKKIRDFSLANVLTVLAIFVSIFLYLYIFMVDPILQAWEANPLTSLISLAYPVFDLFVLMSVLYLLFNTKSGQEPLPIGVLSIGMFVLVFVDIIYGAQVLTSEYLSNSSLSGAYLFSYSVVGLAGVLQFQTFTALPSAKRRELGENLLFINRFVLTMLALVGATVLLIFGHSLPQLESRYTLIATVFVVVVVFSGWVVGLTLIENRRLVRDLATINEQLEERIRERTRDLEISHARLEQLANRDPLTGLPNRSYFINQLEGYLIELQHTPKKRGALLFLDLDEFKSINDTRGHGVGDELLVAVGERLRRCVRQHDVVARLGGDEFVILLVDPKDCDLVRSISQRILTSLQEPFYLKGRDFHISASIGIVDHRFMVDVFTALQNADIAMYAAKHAGRNQAVFYSPAIRSSISTDWQQETRLGD